MQNSNKPNGRVNQPFLVATVIIIAVAVFFITWVGIRQTRNDSLELLVDQGTAFTEALAQATTNAIQSETVFEYLVHLRYSEVLLDPVLTDETRLTETELARLAVAHNFYAIYIIDMDSTLSMGGVARGLQIDPPDFVLREAAELIANPERKYSLLLETGDHPGDAKHYYLEMANDLSKVILVVAEARYYVEALEKTQIGYLVQNMAREPGVEYIIYQTTDGIIFASRKQGDLLAIESDEFLRHALEEGDRINHRVIDFQGREILELVRPFATEKYPYGLFRVGLNLDGYHRITKGYDIHMITLSGILFSLVLVVLLYFNSRIRRKRITGQYAQMKLETDKLFDELRIGVVIVDSNGMISRANEAFARILGIQFNPADSWKQIVGQRSVELATLIERTKPSDDTELIISVDDKERSLIVSVASLEATNSQVVVIYDVTIIRELENKSARKHRLSEMGHLAAGVAHEIRNPLNSISIAAQRLASEFAPEQSDETDNSKNEFRGMTDQIRAETKRLNDIITRFLALAREGKTEPTLMRLDTVLHELADFYRHEAEECSIKLTVEVEENLRAVISRESVEQLFANLFTNAREALNNKPGSFAVNAYRDNKTVVIQFADSGPGVPASMREKLFTPYFTTKEAGTGLGLPTVHRIVTDLGGEVTLLDSESGATFNIQLPD